MWRLGGEDCAVQKQDSRGTGPGSEGAGGHGSRSFTPPGTVGGREGTVQRGCSSLWVALICADQCPLPPEHQASADWETAVVTAGADSRAGDLAPPLLLFLLVSPCV